MAAVKWGCIRALLVIDTYGYGTIDETVSLPRVTSVTEVGSVGAGADAGRDP
jgi:hypothetical protein